MIDYLKIDYDLVVISFKIIKSVFVRLTVKSCKFHYQTHMLSAVSPWYKKLGFQDVPEAAYSERSARETAIKWACRLGHEDCIHNAGRLFRSWLQNGDGRDAWVSSRGIF